VGQQRQAESRGEQSIGLGINQSFRNAERISR
jgi:hypothetical protein